MIAHRSASLQLFPVVRIFLRSLGIICYSRWVLSEGHKKYFMDWACKPDNVESHNSLKLSFTNIRDHCSNFADCESFLESTSPDILALLETNLNNSIDSGNFSMRGYLPLIRKDSDTHMHGLARATSFCTGIISRKLCRFLLMFWTGCISLNVLLLRLCARFLILFHLT